MTSIKSISSEFISNRGSSEKPNEDISLSFSWGAAIFDGATPLTPTRVLGAESDAKWFVTALRERIADKAAAKEQKTKTFMGLLEDSLEKVISEYRSRASLSEQEFSLLSHELPSSSMVAITLERGGVYGYGIGDCELLIKKKNTDRVVRVFRQHPTHRHLDQQTALKYSSARMDKKNHQEARSIVTEELVNNRKKANTSEGFPILTLDPGPLRDVQKVNLSQLFSLEAGDQAIICSDGIVPLYDGYGVFSLSEMFERKLEDIIKVLREVEQGDLSCIKYPRLKPSDDATIGFVRLD